VAQPPPPERLSAVYRDGQLWLVLTPGAGEVWLAGSRAPLFVHPVISGRFVAVPTDAELVPLVQRATSVEGLRAALVERGYEIRETPRSTLAWVFT
jgi:hypothetical protein